MTVEQAMGIAKDAKLKSEQAREAAVVAQALAHETSIRHEEHEKTCAHRYVHIIGLQQDTQKEIKSAKNWAIITLIGMVLSMSSFIYLTGIK